MLSLQNKNALIYGAGGSLGGAVARALANAGATVIVTGRQFALVEKLAEAINATGGKAKAAQVDALNEKEVNDCISNLVVEARTVDISFNAIGLQDTQGIPLTDMPLEDFIRPVNIAMKTQFITSVAAARAMMKQGFGVILSLTATPGGIGYANVGGFGPACCAIESFSRDLASELGPYGIRVVNIRSGGSPDSKVFKEALDHGGNEAIEFIDKMAADTMLKKLPLMEDIANAAVFLASGMADKITGCTLDLTCGTTSALNYKVTPIAFVKK